MQGLNLQVFFQDLQDLHISKEATVIIRSHCDNLASSNSLSAWLHVEGFLKTTDQPTTYPIPPTNQPNNHRPPPNRSSTRCTDHRPNDHRPVKNLRNSKNLNSYLT